MSVLKFLQIAYYVIISYTRSINSFLGLNEHKNIRIITTILTVIITLKWFMSQKIRDYNKIIFYRKFYYHCHHLFFFSQAKLGPISVLFTCTKNVSKKLCKPYKKRKNINQGNFMKTLTFARSSFISLSFEFSSKFWYHDFFFFFICIRCQLKHLCVIGRIQY